MGKRKLTLPSLGILSALVLWACTDESELLQPSSLSSPATTISPQLTGNKSVSVKTNSVDFAEALRSVENENEIIVWVKAEGQARPTASLFSSFTKSSATVALPPGTPGERIR